MAVRTNPYDDYATEYAEYISDQYGEDISFIRHLLVPRLLAYAGDVAGRRVLDAGCGEGHIARMLAQRGAEVTATDLAPRLLTIAQERDPGTSTTYLAHDLSRPLPQYREFFDLVVSNLVLPDMDDYRGYITTLGAVLKPGGRAVLSLLNPYRAVFDKRVKNYFESGRGTREYGGMAKLGVRACYYHRTLEEYITTFRESGLLLNDLSDVCPTDEILESGHPIATKNYHLPLFMVLAFVKQ